MSCLFRWYYFFVLVFILQGLLTLVLLCWIQRLDVKRCAEEVTRHTEVSQAMEKCSEEGVGVSYVSFNNIDSPGDDIAYLQKPSIDDLKRICTSLERCVGFTSSGWIKSAISQKRPLTGSDLYVKVVHSGAETSVSQPEVITAYLMHSAHYQEMLDNLKIYVHASNIGVDMATGDVYKYGVEQLFMDLLSQSGFITSDPEKAHFFFIPIRCTAWRTGKDPQDGLTVARRLAKEMIDDIRINSPFWNFSKGLDHFYVCGDEMGAGILQLVPEWKNVIGLVNTASTASDFFVPNKDMCIPSHPGSGVVPWHIVGTGHIADFNDRSTLLFLSGDTVEGKVRPAVFKLFSSSHDVKLVPGELADSDYMAYLKSTKYCLCLGDSKVWSLCLVQSLWFGCVPVVVADHYLLPLSGTVDWNKAAVTVREDNLLSTLSLLRAITMTQWSALQNHGRKVAYHLTWNDPPRSYDAFYSVLFQLWKRKLL